MTAPLALYGAALRRAADGVAAPLHLVRPRGSSGHDASDWSGGLRPGDRTLLRRCRGATLDVGCGPGRLAGALARTGRDALGIDVSAEAVRQARRRGASAVLGSVFSPLPHEGAWRAVLLADGNIGIGGDPERLLRRCGELIHPQGVILVELTPPSTASWRADVVLRHRGRESVAFPWAGVAAGDAVGLAARCGLRMRHLWTEADRWFAELATA